VKNNFFDDKGTNRPGTNRPETYRPGTKRPYTDLCDTNPFWPLHRLLEVLSLYRLLLLWSYGVDALW